MKKQKVILMIQNYFFHSQKNKMKLAKNNDILRKLANLTSNQLQKRNNFPKRKMKKQAVYVKKMLKFHLKQ